VWPAHVPTLLTGATPPRCQIVTQPRSRSGNRSIATDGRNHDAGRGLLLDERVDLDLVDRWGDLVVVDEVAG
jgi:hypothetical protein